MQAIVPAILADRIACLTPLSAVAGERNAFSETNALAPGERLYEVRQLLVQLWSAGFVRVLRRPQLRQKLPDLVRALTGASALVSENALRSPATALSGVRQTILSARIAGTIACITTNN